MREVRKASGTQIPILRAQVMKQKKMWKGLQVVKDELFHWQVWP